MKDSKNKDYKNWPAVPREEDLDITKDELSRFKELSYRAVERIRSKSARSRATLPVRFKYALATAAAGALGALTIVLYQIFGSPMVMQVANEPESDSDVHIARATEPETIQYYPRETVVRSDGGQAPQLYFPVNTKVTPGKVVFEWEYAGTADVIELVVQDETGGDLLRHEMQAGETSYQWTVEPGRPYFWRIEVPEAEYWFKKFEVLDRPAWDKVKEKLQALGLRGADLTSEISGLEDKQILISLVEIFVESELLRDAQSAYMRLQEIRSTDK